jgi:hypothetical protein
MIDRNVISSYKAMNGELMLFLQKLAVSDEVKPECISLPLIQQQDISTTIPGIITVYDYYNDDINDVIHYTLPQQCDIVDDDEEKEMKSHHYYGVGVKVGTAQHQMLSAKKIDEIVYENVNSI